MRWTSPALFSAIFFLATTPSNAQPLVTESLAFDFDASEGFVDGELSGKNSVIAQDGILVDTTASTLTITNPAAFLRLVAFSGADTLAGIRDLPAGETVSVLADDHTISVGDLPGGNTQISNFGLTTSVNAGGAVADVGVQLRLDQTGEIFFDDTPFGDNGSIGTGAFITANSSLTFDLQVDAVSNGDGTFDVFASLDGGAPIQVQDDRAFQIDPAGPIGVNLQGQGGTLSSISVDAISVTAPVVIPEPASFAMVGIAGAVLLRRRRAASRPR